jgi:small conductance mechanosensitive channel
VSYGTTVEAVRQFVARLCEADPRILKDPDYYIAIEALADSAVNFTVRAYVQHQHYWEVYFDMNTAVYDAFNAQGIGIPFPQLDVHLQSTSTPKEG